MNNWTAIVMAAGKGARMRSSVPKVLHPVAGDPMIRYMVNAAREISSTSTLAVVSPAHRHQIAETCKVDCVEQTEPTGTGHALAIAIPHLPDDTQHLLLLNGDTPLLRSQTLKDLTQLHEHRGAVLTLLSVLTEASLVSDLGRLERDQFGNPFAIIEAKEDDQSDRLVEANVGAYCLDVNWARKAIGRLTPHNDGELYVTDLVELAREDDYLVEVLSLDSVVEGLGVNTMAQLADAENAMQERLRSYWMAQGVTMEDPATTYLHYNVKLAQDVVIRPNSRLLGETRIQKGTLIGPNAQINNTQVAEQCVVGSSILDGTQVEQRVSIGPFCHLRAGTHLEQDVVIGSHVELKNSRIGAGSRINHFAYIGDATVGRDVNIGAGTITCNYDGLEKHYTRIGDKVSIGSDTLLIAPVTVGAYAITGAGAVITRDVPENVTVVGAPAKPLHSRR